MSQPVDPAVAQAVAADQISDIAGNVGGADQTWAGGQPAGPAPEPVTQSPAEVAQNLVAAGGQPAEANLAALQAQIDDLNARLQADADSKAQAAADAEPKPPVLEEIIGALSGMAPGIVHAFQVIAARLEKAGL